MGRVYERVLSMLLAIIFAMQLMPASVLAETAAQDTYVAAEETAVQDTYAAAEETAAQDIYGAEEAGGEAADEAPEVGTEVVGELEQLREADVKHFINSDGSFTAVKYSRPVHYQAADGGQWLDIDNSLSIDSGNSVYTPESSPVDVEFPQSLDDGSPVTLRHGGHVLSWAYVNDIAVGGLSAGQSAVQAQKLELQQTEDAVSDCFSAGSDLTDGLVYGDVYPNVDLEYVLDSTELKENIVLKNKNAQNEFTAVYNIGSLFAEQENEQNINLKDAENNTVFSIFAPCMYDAAGNVSSEVSLSIVSNTAGVLKVKLTADSAWLGENDRQFPVRIDPYVGESIVSFDGDASAVYKSTDYPYGTLAVGNDGGTTVGKAKSYVKFSLPKLKAGDTVTAGILYLRQFTGTYGYSHVETPSLDINVYKVTSAWDETSVRNSTSYSGLPTNGQYVIDRQTVSSSTVGKWISFDVSKTVKEWYEGAANYGLCLRANDESARALATFVSSNNTANPSLRPELIIQYRNNKGLESYWSAHTQDLGASGTGSINDYTGNLVYTVPLLSTSGSRMPVALSLVYNGFQAGSNVDRKSTVGKGWRLNIQESVTQITDSGGLNSKLYEMGFRFAYDDADGTTHYFKADSSGKYVDEDGLGLTLSVNDTVTDSEKYVITVQSGGKMSFMPNGALRKVYDDSGNYCKIFYSDSTLGIIRITDGAGRTIGISSDANGRITEITDPAGRKTTLTYSSSWDGLRCITYPDGTQTGFTYTDSGVKLCRVEAVNGCEVRYGYSSTGDSSAQSRVCSVTEYGSGDEVGNSISISYAGLNRTTFTDNKSRSSIFQFDNFGRTVSVLDADGSGSRYSYSDSSGKAANSVSGVGSAPGFTDNLLLNHSFETSLGDTWTSESAASDSTYNYYGAKSVKLTAGGSVSQSVSRSGDSFTVSAYARGSSSSSVLRLCVYFYDADDVYLSSQYSDCKLQSGTWARKHFSFTVPDGASGFRVCLINVGADSIWLDCAQLEYGDTVSEYNLIQNGDFENTSSGAWESVNCSGSDGFYTNGKYIRHFYMKSSADVSKRLVQKIYINKPASKVFLSVSGYAYAHSLPMDDSDTRQFALSVAFHCTDGTYTYEYIPFNADYSAGWQYTSGTVGVKNPGSKTVDFVYIRCCYYNNANSANFDRIQVNIDSSGTSYTYDDDGNLISAKDNAGRHETYSYNSASDLTGITATDSKAYSFTYSDTYKHRLLSAVSVSSGVKNSFSYDSYGNVSSVSVQKSDGSGKYIRQYSSYTSDGNYLEKAYTDRGYATTYGYDLTKGTLNSVTDPNGVVTGYTYDSSNDRLTSVTSGGASASYSYSSRGLLTGISSPGASYSLSYDAFGKNTGIALGEQSLITNNYASGNGNLLSSEYGNGFFAEYSYDFLDRLTAKKYNGVEAYSWRYNSDGLVGSFTDHSLGKSYSYSYDGIGRLLQTDCSDGSLIRAKYNDLDLTTSLHYEFGPRARDIYFSYSSKDNLPGSVSFGPSAAYSVTRSYDSLTRPYLDAYAVTDTSATLKAEYSYTTWSSDANRTTGTVRGIDYTYSCDAESGDLLVRDRYYTYDHAGNILTESIWKSGDTPNILLESYSYDGQNRLIRHDSVSQNKSFTYAYDASGNITSKSEYAYTTEELGEATGTVSYTYANENWGDLLTAYGGQSITYDAIGNPTEYRGLTFSWQGRQLSSAAEDGTSLSFTYDANGVRTSKTVNGTRTEYFLNGSQILAQKTGDSLLSFVYDANGRRVAMADAANHFYYYIYNVQGDVIALADADTGKIAATYTYDAWGKCVSIENAAGFTVGNDNPFRFKGYYFDSETGLYYLNSRYYDPEVGRFVNADSLLTASVIGANLFAYCENTPVMGYDPTGHLVWDVLDWGMAALSWNDFICDPSLETLGWALADTASLLPVVPSFSYARRGVQAIDAVSDARKVSKVGWKVGDSIDNLTKAGNVPSWSTVRQRYWKNEAFYNPFNYEPEYLPRMEKGKPPLIQNPIDGKFYPMELHHIKPQREGGLNTFDNLLPVSPWKHSEIDKFRHFRPIGG